VKDLHFENAQECQVLVPSLYLVFVAGIERNFADFGVFVAVGHDFAVDGFHAFQDGRLRRISGHLSEFQFHFHPSDNKENELKLPLGNGNVVLSRFEFSATAETGSAGQWSPAGSRDVERRT